MGPVMGPYWGKSERDERARMTYTTIKCQTDAGVAEVTLNRPDALNALTTDMLEELRDVVRRIIHGEIDARALLITGEGRGFCSGADLRASMARAADGPVASDSGAMLMDKYHPLFLELSHLDIPVITAVNGIAAGAGMSLAITADFVLASQSAAFLQAFVNIGLIPDAGSTWLLPRLIGPARARRMMMLGEQVKADQALEWGLVHSVSPDGELMTHARALAHKLANGPTLAYSSIRSLMRSSFYKSYPDQIQQEAVHQRKLSKTADSKEGVAAFIEKRPAAFKGA